MPDFVVDLDVGDGEQFCVAIRADNRSHAAVKARALARSRWHACDPYPYVASVETYASVVLLAGSANACDYDLRRETDPKLS